MKKSVLKSLDKIILVFLGFLGFFGCETPAEYGTPYADYEISGTITDSISSEPISQIKVILSDSIDYTYQNSIYPAHEYIRDTVYSDSSGKYSFKFTAMPYNEVSFHLKTIDIDGPSNNGDYKSRNVNVNIISTDWIDKVGKNWYTGKAIKEQDIKLQKK